jgi:hypothetical protein
MAFKAYYRDDIRNVVEAALISVEATIAEDDVVSEKTATYCRGYVAALATVARAFGIVEPPGAAVSLLSRNEEAASV